MDITLDWIVQTKLQPPQLRPATVQRPRLLTALTAALATQKLTLVSAPAGYGKTSAIAAAARLLPAMPTLWIACDPDDNDPARFLLLLIHGLRQLNPHCGALAQALLDSLDNPGAQVRRIIGVLINEIIETLPACVVILDDLHVIDDLAVYAGLDYLLERLPAAMHVVVATRADPPLALARLRAQGQLAEIRLADLCFTPQETAVWLNDHLGLALSPTNLELLQHTTGGWAAALSLVATAAQRPPAGESWSLIDALARADQFIFDFLAEEVLRHEDAAIRVFLLETSVLSDLTPALCAAVSGRADAAQLLDELYRRNLFVVAVDPAGRVLRYQPLFAAFLRAQRDRIMPERAAELHRRAARAEPSPERAIPHYLAAAEWLEAAALIERIGEQWLQHGLVEMVHGWIAALPDPIRQRPRLRFLLGLCRWRMGQLAEAGEHLKAAMEGLADAERDAALAHLADWAFIQGDFEGCAALIEQARPADRPPATQIQLLLGRFRLAVMGRAWVQALAHLDAALAVCERAGDPAVFAQLANLVNIVMIAGLPGGIERIERVVRWGARWPAVAVGPTRVALETQAAVISLWRGDLVQALEIGGQALDLGRRLGGTTPYLDIFLPGLVAVLHMALGDNAAADSAFAIMLGHVDQGLIAGPLVAGAFYNVGRARWMQGRLTEARQFHQRLSAIDASSVPVAMLLAQLLGGLLAMAEGDLAAAERSLRQTAFMEQMSGPAVRVLASPRLVLATFYERCGRPAEALAEFAPLLEECLKEGRLGLILREGAAVIPLLRLAIQHKLQAEFAAELLGRLGVAAGPRPLHNPATGATLSVREVEVLGLLAAGASNKEIADTLIISAATVKTHLLHIFQKLDVRTRTQAVARARELRLP